MTDILITSRKCATALVLVMAATGSAQVRPSTVPTEMKTPPAIWKGSRTIWKGVEEFELGVTYTEVHPAANQAPGNAVEKIVLKFTYIEETNFLGQAGTDANGLWNHEARILSQKLSWNAYRKATATNWLEVTCVSAGDLELVGLSREAIAEKLKLPCDTKHLSYPNAYWGPGFPSTLPIELPKLVDWRDLREGRSYSESDDWGAVRHSYSVEVSTIMSCADYNATNPIPGLPANSELKAGDIQIIPDASSILPDGRTKLHITFTCDSLPVKNARLDLTIEAQPNSGGHIHGGDRPRGKLDSVELKSDTDKREVVTDSDGKADVLFEPGTSTDRHIGIAGIYKVTAKGQNESEGSATVAAEVKGLQPLADGSSFVGSHYVIVRGDTDTHPEGTYGTAATTGSIAKMAVDFFDAQARANDKLTHCKDAEGIVRAHQTFEMQPLSVNDISLPNGGHFDVEATKWKGSHQTHGEGKGVDFNHNFEKKDKDGKVIEIWVAGCDPLDPLVRLGGWLTIMMLDTGVKYGHWDQYDLFIGKWHLHVDR